MPLRRKRTFSNSSESISAGNILNGVLDCKWNRTSATPSLLEIANTSEVKFNISQMTPLVLRFADGWDDIDQPKGVVKKITTPPPNINLSDKANCHVQIVAKVINDELVITTHTTYDPAVGYGSNILPNFSSGRGGTDAVATKDGWTISATRFYDASSAPWKVADRATGSYFAVSAGSTAWLMIDPPYAVSLSVIRASGWLWANHSGLGYSRIAGWDSVSNTWVDLVPPWPEYIGRSSWETKYLTESAAMQAYSRFGFYVVSASGMVGELGEIELYERPVVKYFRSLNKVKDRSDVEQLWINLGYATVDASGNITALNHYTDLRNNYPGGMRVEA